MEMKDKKKMSATFMTQASMIAAIYVVLTMVFAPFGFGEVQIRIAEALTILPMFTKAAIPGLFLGCLIGNILGGSIIVDVAFGSLATLLGATGAYLLRNNKRLVPIPPILANACIVPFILKYGYGVPLPIPLMMITVGLGEVISCGILGSIVMKGLENYKGIIFSGLAK